MRVKFLFLLLLSGVVLCSSVVSEPPPLPYRVGVILPLSGPMSSLGQYVKRGIDLGYEHLPADLRSRVELCYEDDEFLPAKTISAYRKLSGSPGIDAAFVIGSTPANALTPIVEADRKILIAIGASDASIAVGKEYSFIHWVIPPVLGEVLARELVRRDFKRIAIEVVDASGGVALGDGLKFALEKLGQGGRILQYERFQNSQSDFRTEISRLKSKRADAVVLAFFPGPLSSFAKQYRSSGLAADLIGMETFEDAGEVKNAEGALTGRWYVNASDPTPWFVDAYKAKYGEAPGWASANGFDSVTLIAKAAAVSTENARVRDYLRSVSDYSGAAGIYSASGDNRFNLPAVLKTITADGFVPMK